ncbi:hypothetical protein DMC30DRAFT_301431 [Rhodotorula diobovata]|uniref:Uncharacterized protein n=1 Tax=Rhodotorula diobovata TaxID=5288 RepID=A0A5C5FTC6_9BASI|nr:hypothetical protein DMC30DRAFT_301431 [Rhodotorula diobovata]
MGEHARSDLKQDLSLSLSLSLSFPPLASFTARHFPATESHPADVSHSLATPRRALPPPAPSRGAPHRHPRLVRTLRGLPRAQGAREGVQETAAPRPGAFCPLCPVPVAGQELTTAPSAHPQDPHFDRALFRQGAVPLVKGDAVKVHPLLDLTGLHAFPLGPGGQPGLWPVDLQRVRARCVQRVRDGASVRGCGDQHVPRRGQRVRLRRVERGRRHGPRRPCRRRRLLGDGRGGLDLHGAWRARLHWVEETRRACGRGRLPHGGL